MNYLSVGKETLTDFRNLLMSSKYQEARSLLECKQEEFQKPLKLFGEKCSEWESHAAPTGGCFCYIFGPRGV